MQLRGMLALGLAVAMLAGGSGVSRGALSSQNDLPLAVSHISNHVEANQYQLSNGRVAGNLSARQTMTAWQVTGGTWNGQNLDGLSLVLVQSVSDDGRALGTTCCYISHLATAAQKKALISAFMANHAAGDDVAGGMEATDPATWRVEPAVIKIEIMGETVVIHLGAIA